MQAWIADLQREGKLKSRSIKNVWKVLRLILGKKRVKDWTIRLPKNPKKRSSDGSPCWKWNASSMRLGASTSAYFNWLGLPGCVPESSSGCEGKIWIWKTLSFMFDVALGVILRLTPKTDAGHRDVDIDAQTARLLKKHLGDRKTGLVFPSRNNTPLVNRNINVDVLRVICKRLGIPNAGMHAFRHGRISRIAGEGSSGRSHYTVGRTRESENHEPLYPLF